jgi:hypothetical protein
VSSVCATRVSACVLIQLGREGVLKRNGIKRENKGKDKLSPFFFLFLYSFQSFPVIRVQYCLLVYLCRGTVSLGYVIYFAFVLLLLDKKNTILMCSIVYLLRLPLIPTNLNTRSWPGYSCLSSQYYNI